MNDYNYNFFQTGGTLPPGFPSYIEREADNLLFKELKKESFCYILSARQMGKSSLCANVMRKLAEEGYACCFFDITRIGTNNISTDQWYYTLLDIINEDLQLEFDISSWWQKENNITQVYRFFKFLKTVVLEKIQDKKIVLFFDEIDSLLSVNKTQFNTDDFFAAIRSIYLERANNPEFNRLSFVVIGVASPNELMSDSSRTPFNIGVSIPVENFTPDEAHVLKNGFTHLGCDIDKLLNKILYWTGGQPILTQKLCQSIAENSSVITTIPKLVKNKVEKKFILKPITDSDNINLLNIQNRIVKNNGYGMQMLNLYEKIYDGEKIKHNVADPAVIYLMLAGLINKRNDRLVINNKIYKKRFGRDWISEIRQSLERPFNKELNEWIASGRSKEKLLNDRKLEEYDKWFKTRSDHSEDEQSFLIESKVEKGLQAREEAKDRAPQTQIERTDIEEIKRMGAR